MVWIAASAIGMIFARTLLKRERAIEALIWLFEKAELEISHYSLSLASLVKEAAKESSARLLPFILLCAKKTENGTDFPKAWKESVEKAPPPLSKKEREELSNFGFLLSSCDKEGALKMLDFYKKSFDFSLSDARAARKKYSKPCIFSGFFVGGIIFITLI